MANPADKMIQMFGELKELSMEEWDIFCKEKEPDAMKKIEEMGTALATAKQALNARIEEFNQYGAMSEQYLMALRERMIVHCQKAGFAPPRDPSQTQSTHYGPDFSKAKKSK